jgi:uncharacterized protein YsxB (DUF464 family)
MEYGQQVLCAARVSLLVFAFACFLEIQQSYCAYTAHRLQLDTALSMPIADSQYSAF